MKSKHMKGNCVYTCKWCARKQVVTVIVSTREIGVDKEWKVDVDRKQCALS